MNFQYKMSWCWEDICKCSKKSKAQTERRSAWKTCLTKTQSIASCARFLQVAWSPVMFRNRNLHPLQIWNILGKRFNKLAASFLPSGLCFPAVLRLSRLFNTFDTRINRHVVMLQLRFFLLRLYQLRFLGPQDMGLMSAGWICVGHVIAPICMLHELMFLGGGSLLYKLRIHSDWLKAWASGNHQQALLKHWWVDVPMRPMRMLLKNTMSPSVSHKLVRSWYLVESEMMCHTTLLIKWGRPGRPKPREDPGFQLCSLSCSIHFVLRASCSVSIWSPLDGIT